MGGANFAWRENEGNEDGKYGRIGKCANCKHANGRANQIANRNETTGVKLASRDVKTEELLVDLYDFIQFSGNFSDFYKC